MSSNKKLQNLRQIAGVSLLLHIIRRFDNQLKSTVPIGKKFDRNIVPSQEERGQAISATAGNPKTNRLFIKHINLLIKELNKKYPYKPLIQKRAKQCLQTFNIATGGHFENWENLIQKSVIEAFTKSTVLSKQAIIPEEVLELLGDRSGDEI